jgi:2-polyprenyl-3-methyl-5-hydroxy-6-metoxy-1,4-benzoquinol methylase
MPIVPPKEPGYYGHSRHEMLRYIPATAKRILDVGCGSGEFGKLLKSFICAEIWGIDVNTLAAGDAKSRLDQVLVGDIEEDSFDLPLNYFDCIVFNDLLEHLKWPWQTVQTFRAFLVKNGVVVASVPNVRYFSHLRSLLLHKEWVYGDAGILDRTHLRFFTVKSIEAMFRQAGYDVVTLEGINKSRVSIKFRVANWLLGGGLDDMRYPQFACVARKADNSR